MIMKQDVLHCLLVGFWHLCHKLKCIMCIILCVNFLCDYMVLNHVKPFYSGDFSNRVLLGSRTRMQGLETMPTDADENLILKTVKCQCYVQYIKLSY